MLIARAFCMMRRSVGLFSGLGPAALTAIVISLPMRANALDILSQRANIVALRVSKMRPMRPSPVEVRPSLAQPRGPEQGRGLRLADGALLLVVADAALGRLD